MHEPTPVRPGVAVEYVDLWTRAQSLARFPELDATKMVEPDHIDDGFVLSSIDDASVSFLIAHHVLEHAADPIGVLETWSRVLRPGGVLLVSVPVASKCFDRGRPLADLEHLIDDHDLQQRGASAEMRARNRRHLVEVLTISNPTIERDEGRTPQIPIGAKLDAMVEEHLDKPLDIHFHTFSARSFRRLLGHFCSRVAPDMSLLRLLSGSEVHAVLRKR